MNKPTYTPQTLQQAKMWCDLELLEHQRHTRQLELDFAFKQGSKAFQHVDHERRYYWEGVEQRIVKGSRLVDARQSEHDARKGPSTYIVHNGMQIMVSDLDFWLLP